MPFLYAIALDAAIFVLAATVLVFTLQDMLGHDTTPADGLAIAILSPVMTLGIGRIALLRRMRSSSNIHGRQQTLLFFSTAYLLLLWTMLQIGMRFLQPQRPHFTLVHIACKVGVVSTSIVSVLVRFDARSDVTVI